MERHQLKPAPVAVCRLKAEFYGEGSPVDLGRSTSTGALMELRYEPVDARWHLVPAFPMFEQHVVRMIRCSHVVTRDPGERLPMWFTLPSLLEL